VRETSTHHDRGFDAAPPRFVLVTGAALDAKPAGKIECGGQIEAIGAGAASIGRDGDPGASPGKDEGIDVGGLEPRKICGQEDELTRQRGASACARKLESGAQTPTVVVQDLVSLRQSLVVG